MTTRALVTGAGGFIGHHLVKRLKEEGFWVRGVDRKKPQFGTSAADEFQVADLREPEDCHMAVHGVDDVYNLAADMGGIGYISGNFATIARNNSLINLHMLEASRIRQVSRFFFSSSACVYNQQLQSQVDDRPLAEDDATPAAPEKGYGWEKLFAENMCQYYYEEFGLETRVARFHNIYGPLGTYDGGREKAPAAACRKIALASDGDEISIWGDGRQTRSFCFIDDCVEGVRRLIESEFREPLNVGSDELVTIRGLFDLVARIAGKNIQKRFDVSKPQGVRGRNSDNSLIRQVLGWEPSIALEEGLRRTYRWIEGEVASQSRLAQIGGRNGDL